MENAKMLRVPKVADMLGVSTRTVNRMLADGQLPKVKKVRGCRVIPLVDVQVYMDKIRGH